MPMPIRHRATLPRLAPRAAACAVFCVTGLAAFLPGFAAARGALTPAPGARQAVPGVVVLKLEAPAAGVAAKSTGLPAVDALLAAHGTTAIAPVLPPSRLPRKPTRTDLSRVYVVRYADGAAPAVVAADLARLPGVEYAEPQWLHSIDVLPNDPNYTNQSAYLSRMRLPQAWDVTRGEQGAVVVAIVDGGTNWQHADLQNTVWTNPGEVAGNSIDDDGNGFVDDVHGWNFANETGDPTGLPAAPINGMHGTHTAGIACAVADNSIGIAGASWNATLMPINASGSSDQTIGWGFQGIVYAVDNGADIVNCSWGSLGGASTFELEVITYAWEHGTAVVAAAGNNTSTQPHYPSAYPHVLSVANVNNFDVLYNNSNRGPTIDVCAQGLSIFSTVPGNTYTTMTGTSMSSPHAAAICALVKTRWPGYTPDQVMERVRATCDNIEGVNPSRVGQLGKGRVNAEAALTKNTPAVRLAAVAYTESDGDGIVEPGETVTLTLSVTNFLANASSLTFRLRETSAHASAVDSIAVLGSLDSLQSAVLPPLTFDVAPTAPIQHVVDLQVAISSDAPAYSDRDRFSITVLPTFVNHDANRITTSVTSVGRLGFSVAAGGTGSDGVGLRYDNSPNLLYEGALMLGTGPTKISNAARSAGSGGQDEDFVTATGGTPHLSEPGTWAPEQTVASFTDALASSPLPVRVRQESFAYVDPTHDDYVILRYTITNTGGASLDGLRAGWYCDWDLDGNTFNTNQTGFDVTRDLGYVHDTSTGPTAYVGIQVLNSEGATSYRGIWNDQALSPDWGVYDDFTDIEKWDCLAGGVVHPAAGPADISNSIATGPFTLAPGDSVAIGFAFLGGSDLAALQVNADAAALKWQHLQSGVPVELYDLSLAQEGRDVVVRWRTSRETDVVAFRVHRSRDGGPFEPLGPDLAPEADRAYAFTDVEPAPGTYVYRIGEVASDGSVLLHGSAAIHVGAAVPARTFLDPAVPNPFNPSTTLRFGLASGGPATVEVFDARGRLVRTLLRLANAAPGFRTVTWDGRSESGTRVASGVYVVRLRVAGSAFSRRLTLLK